MKRFIITVFTMAMFLSSSPIYAYQYGFESGADTQNTFGSPTSNDDPVPVNTETTNVRRNKDASHFPPSYGVFSGDIPTDQTSPYHNNDPNITASSNTAWSSSVEGSNIGSVGISNFSGDSNLPDQMLPTTSITYTGTGSINQTQYTTAEKYNDGSIGTLYIAKIGKTLKVYEGETLENMKKGIGHFEMTSAWDGNVGFSGHNRGASGYFSFVKDLKIGDKITYTTKYGKRTYEIYYKEKINDSDYSNLGWTPDNVLTLITCVENVPDLRWCVQAREI